MILFFKTTRADLYNVSRLVVSPILKFNSGLESGLTAQAKNVKPGISISIYIKLHSVCPLQVLKITEGFIVGF